MNQFSRSICGWRTVLVVLLVAPVFILDAQLFQLPQHHHSNLFLPMQFPTYNFFRQHTINAKNLETLNSREILSSGDYLMVNAEKPVDAKHKMHRIEQLQQEREPVNYIDSPVENKNKFFDEDGNKMRPHGQPGPHRNVAKSISLAERLLSNLAANNLAVNFSQSTSSNLQFPFDGLGGKFALSGRSDRHERDKNVVRYSNHKPQVIIVNGPTRIYGAGTESKFPPFLEFFVQRIQKYFSIYKYEDLSRPGLPSQTLTETEADNIGEGGKSKEVNAASRNVTESTTSVKQREK